MIYLLYRVDLKSEPQPLQNAFERNILGYAENKGEASFFQDFYEGQVEKYEGWDGKKYPIFFCEEIEPL